MWHPADRTSHLARFHPYSRAHPRYSEIGLWYDCHVSPALFTLYSPNQTAVDYRFLEPPSGRVQGLASIAVRNPAVILVFVFFDNRTARLSQQYSQKTMAKPKTSR